MIFFRAASFYLVSFSVVADSSVVNNIGVYATEKFSGSNYVSGKSLYTKTFDVTIGNLSNKDIDLSKICLKAYSSDNRELFLDTVDEKLTSGILKGGNTVKSFAMFASETDDISGATLVKVSDRCK